MAGVQELAPALGAGAACKAMGLWRGAPARLRARLLRATKMDAPRPARPLPPLAFDAQETEAPLRANDLETSESEEFSLLGVGPRSHGYANQRREVGWSRWG